MRRICVHPYATSQPRPCYFYLRDGALILIARTTLGILWFIFRSQTDQSSKQDATRDHSRIFQDRRRARRERDSQRRFFLCDFCTSVCRLFPTLLWAIFRLILQYLQRQIKISSVGWNSVRDCKTCVDIGTLRQTSSALQ